MKSRAVQGSEPSTQASSPASISRFDSLFTSLGVLDHGTIAHVPHVVLGRVCQLGVLRVATTAIRVDRRPGQLLPTAKCMASRTAIEKMRRVSGFSAAAEMTSAMDVFPLREPRRLTSKLTCPARLVSYESRKAVMRAGSGAAPGSAWLHCFVSWPTIPLVLFGVIHAWLLRF